MNVMTILNQLMSEASGSQTASGGSDVNRMVGELASQINYRHQAALGIGFAEYPA